MDKAHLEQLIVGGESSKVEFKLNVPPEHALGADLSAFANTDGGTVIIGVDDKGGIKGLTAAEAKEAQVRLWRISESLLSQPIEIGETIIRSKRVVYAVVDPAPQYLRPIKEDVTFFFVRRRLCAQQWCPFPLLLSKRGVKCFHAGCETDHFAVMQCHFVRRRSRHWSTWLKM